MPPTRKRKLPAPVSPSSRRISGSEHEINPSANLGAFLRSRSSSAVKQESEMEMEEPVEIPDPSSSPPIVVEEWSSGSDSSYNSDKNTDKDGNSTSEDASGDEEFILGLDSDEPGAGGVRNTRATSQIPSQNHAERILKTRGRVADKPGPKSRKKLATKPKTSSKKLSPTSSEGSEGLPKRKRRRKRKIRYTLTKEDHMEADLIMAKLLSDSDKGSATDAGFQTNFVPIKKSLPRSPPKSKPKSVTTKARCPTPTPPPPAEPEVHNQQEKEEVEEEEEGPIEVELPGCQGSNYTVQISKATFELLNRPRTPSCPHPAPAAVASTSSAPSAATSHSARAWLTSRRNAALVTSKLYQRLMSRQGRCQVKLFDMGILGVSKITLRKYKQLLEGFESPRKGARKLPQSPPSSPRVSAAEFERFRLQFGIKPVQVALDNIGANPATCPICEKSIPIATLGRHKAEHKIKCHYEGCGVDVTLGDVVRHGVSHINGGLKCETCGAEAGTKESLWCHQNKHFGVKPIICTECGDSFAFTSSYRRHFAGKHMAPAAGGSPKESPKGKGKRQQGPGVPGGSPSKRVSFDPMEICEVVQE